MPEILLEFLLFLLKTLTIAAAILAIVVVIINSSRGEGRQSGIKLEKLNDKYRQLGDKLRQQVLGKKAWREYTKTAKKERKQAEGDETEKRRVFVIHFKGDIRASAVDSLRVEVSTVLAVATTRDEVVICLENAGGTVPDHGLGASQLQRIRDRGIPLTVIVDKVAASGGYLMACVAERIIAAPFAIVGSIGVLAQLPNFNRFLERRGIDFEQVTAGRYKRTLTLFGKNTDEHRDKARQELEEVHVLFKAAVASHRPLLDLDAVATGEYWHGSRALELGLIDELGTSDDYLLRAAEAADVFAVTYKGHESLMQRLQGAFTAAAEAAGLGPRMP